jgi:hypothetical protein
MGRIVISCYRPKPEQEQGLRKLMKTQLPESAQMFSEFTPVEVDT